MIKYDDTKKVSYDKFIKFCNEGNMKGINILYNVGVPTMKHIDIISQNDYEPFKIVCKTGNKEIAKWMCKMSLIPDRVIAEVYMYSLDSKYKANVRRNVLKIIKMVRMTMNKENMKMEMMSINGEINDKYVSVFNKFCLKNKSRRMMDILINIYIMNCNYKMIKYMEDNKMIKYIDKNVYNMVATQIILNDKRKINVVKQMIKNKEEINMEKIYESKTIAKEKQVMVVLGKLGITRNTKIMANKKEIKKILKIFDKRSMI